MNSSLKTILLLLMFAQGGCSALGWLSSSPPATREDLQAQSQRLHEMIQQQSDRTVLINSELQKLNAALNELKGSMHNSEPAKIVMTGGNCPAPPPGRTKDGKLLLGSTEWVWLDAAAQAFEARIDTGAQTSSISAAEITIFERDSKQWVSFYINHQGINERIQIETPLVRRVRIRQASTSESEHRSVVLLSVRVGDQREKTEFSLTDRSDMKYPMLLGRNFLKDIAMVDVAREFIQPKPRLKDAR